MSNIVQVWLVHWGKKADETVAVGCDEGHLDSGNKMNQTGVSRIIPQSLLSCGSMFSSQLSVCVFVLEPEWERTLLSKSEVFTQALMT